MTSSPTPMKEHEDSFENRSISSDSMESQEQRPLNLSQVEDAEQIEGQLDPDAEFFQ